MRIQTLAAVVSAGIVAVVLGLEPGPVSAAVSAAPVGVKVAPLGYSDPTLYPARDPVMVGCITTNCPHADHKGFAINIDAQDKTLGDVGVYPMGAGILHVGAPVGVDDCGTTAKSTRGDWVWIDHGGGVVSQYLHLYTVATQLDGHYVTPRTEIGTMGYTGSDKCGTPYLDFAVRSGGIHGPLADMTTLTACESGRTVSYPSAFTDASTWDQVPYKTKLYRHQDNGCVPTSFPSPSEPSGLQAQPGAGQATLSWSAPTPSQLVGAVQVETQTYQPTTDSFGGATYRAVTAGATSTVVTGLVPATYRFRVSFHNRIGWSPPSAWVTATTQ